MFQPWNIYHIFVTDINPQKYKFCVCFDGGLTPSFFLVNSEARFHNLGQIPIEPSDHTVIKHQSFIDLSKVPRIENEHLTPIDDRGPLSGDVKLRVEQALRIGVAVLTEQNHKKALDNLN